MTLQVFDYVKAINTHKDLLREEDNIEQAEAGYIPFLTNRSFSYHLDTIFYANEMNLLNSHAPKLMQYDYLFNSIKPAKRFGWQKKVEQPDIDILQEYYKCSIRSARRIRKVLNDEQMDMIKQRIIKGGI
jgi:hypothetical protein